MSLPDGTTQCTALFPQSVIETPKVNCPSQETEETSKTKNSCRKCQLIDERPTGTNTTKWMGRRWSLTSKIISMLVLMTYSILNSRRIAVFFLSPGAVYFCEVTGIQVIKYFIFILFIILTILECILKKWAPIRGIGLIRLRRGIIGESLWMRNCTFGFHNSWR